MVARLARDMDAVLAAMAEALATRDWAVLAILQDECDKMLRLRCDGAEASPDLMATVGRAVETLDSFRMKINDLLEKAHLGDRHEDRILRAYRKFG